MTVNSKTGSINQTMSGLLSCAHCLDDDSEEHGSINQTTSTYHPLSFLNELTFQDDRTQLASVNQAYGQRNIFRTVVNKIYDMLYKTIIWQKVSDNLARMMQQYHSSEMKHRMQSFGCSA